MAKELIRIVDSRYISDVPQKSSKKDVSQSVAKPVTDFFVSGVLQVKKTKPISGADRPSALATQSAYVLAGGASRRMGRDKLFVSVDGQPLLARTLTVCESAFVKVSIVAKSAEKFSGFNAPVIIDYPNAPGPLGGIIAALSHCQDGSCFITAADLADIDVETIHSLCENYNGEDYFGLREPGGVQPLCGIYAKRTLETLLAVAADNKPYHLWRIIETLNSRLMPVQKKLWRNINTPTDIQAQPIGTDVTQ